MRTRTLVVGALLLALAGGVGWVAMTGQGRRLLTTGKTHVEDWVAAQLSAIVDDHIRPDFVFDSLIYQPPNTVTLKGVRLSEGRVSIVEVESIRIELARIPQRGEPIVLENVVFQTPVVHLIPRTDGSLLGFSDFVKPGKGATRPDGGSTRLTDVLAIRTIRISAGAVSYEPPSRPPMVLRPLTFDLSRAEAATDSAPVADPGWYAFAADATLDPVVAIHADARLNVNNGDLDLQPLTVRTALQPQQYQVFTPSIQELLKEYQVSGSLNGRLTGVVGLGDMSRSAFDVAVHLAEARGVVREYEIPVKRLDVAARYSSGVLDVTSVDAEAFQGTAQLSGKLSFAEPGSRFEVQGRGQNMQLQDLMHDAENPDADFRGEVSFNVSISGSMNDPRQTLTGQGHASIAKGRLALVEIFRRELLKRGVHNATDRAEADFVLSSDRVTLSNLQVVGNLIGIRGGGDAYYDGRLDMLVNAGPLERIESGLGPLGDLFHKITGELVKYQVTGTLSDTKVKVLPLGLGAEKTD